MEKNQKGKHEQKNGKERSRMIPHTYQTTQKDKMMPTFGIFMHIPRKMIRIFRQFLCKMSRKRWFFSREKKHRLVMIGKNPFPKKVTFAKKQQQKTLVLKRVPSLSASTQNEQREKV